MKNKLRRYVAALIAGALCFASLCAASLAESPEALEPAQQLMVFEFPNMGMNLSIPESLLNRIDQNELAPIVDEVGTDDESALRYGQISWNTVTVLSQEEDDDMSWDLDCFGVLGVYQIDMEEQLYELTGCDTHEKLGESADGAYQYYLSVKSTADVGLIEELRQIRISITDMAPYEPYIEDGEDGALTGMLLGEFNMQDINGQSYTQDMFKDYDLTMVNVFTTWCSPCVEEIPELEKLHQAMADKGVNVVGVVLDALDENGEVHEDTLEKAKLLAERTGATYPFLIPDSTYLNGRLSSIAAVPETFFVDRNGIVVGETYVGSNSFDGWMEAVEKELSGVKEGA